MHADAGDPQGGWFSIALDKRVVEALVAGASHGLMLMDGSTGVDRNCYISSKEGGKGAYLTVTVEGDDKDAPPVPGNAALKPAPNEATTERGAAELTFTVPDGALAYRIKVNGTGLPRWRIPFAGKAGATQAILLEDLDPDAEINLEIVVVDAAGNASPAASVKGKSSAKLSAPKLPESEWKPQGGEAPAIAGKLKVWAYPEVSKLDPLTGKIMLEKGMDAADSKNAVWDAGSKTVRVAAARGEIAGFQVALQLVGDAVGEVSVQVEGLDGVQAKLWRTWFVKVKEVWQAEYALPQKAEAAFSIPAADNKVEGQKAAAIAVDLSVPESAKPGELTGSLVVMVGGESLKLPLKLKIFPAVIPKEINFNPEFNCYGGPGKAGSDLWFDSFRVAHYHRCTINRVPYNQSGNVHGDYVPAVDKSGKVTDWSNFDRNVGPLLSGEAFKDNPRAGVPVKTIYLPVNENWPSPMAANFDPGVDLSSEKTWKAELDVFGKAPEAAFSQAYKDAMSACVKDFVKHFEEKGWTKTQAQMYLNNKPGKGKRDGQMGTAWTMDEPFEYLDWHALKLFSQLFHKGTQDAKSANFAFCGDISRPQWQGSCMDGLMEIMYVGGVYFEVYRLVRDQKRRMPTILYAYGAANNQERANHETTAWCLKTWASEGEGCLPWQSLGGDGAFDKGDGDGNGNALIVDGSKRFGVNAIASFRVHAFRSGAQLCELLRLLEQKKGWGRAHSGVLVSQIIPLSAKFKQAFQDDAAALTFECLNGAASWN